MSNIQSLHCEIIEKSNGLYTTFNQLHKANPKNFVFKHLVTRFNVSIPIENFISLGNRTNFFPFVQLLDNLKNGTYKNEVLEELPNNFTIKTASSLLNIFKTKNILPSNFLPSFEGGFIIEFIVNTIYNCIEIHNEGAIVLVQELKAQPTKIAEIDFENLKIQLNNIFDDRSFDM